MQDLPPSSSNWGDDCRVRDAKRWEMRADRVGDVAWRKVGVVLLGHPRVSMAKLLSDDAHRYAAHGERRAMSVPKNME